MLQRSNFFGKDKFYATWQEAALNSLTSMKRSSSKQLLWNKIVRQTLYLQKVPRYFKKYFGYLGQKGKGMIAVEENYANTLIYEFDINKEGEGMTILKEIDKLEALNGTITFTRNGKKFLLERYDGLFMFKVGDKSGRPKVEDMKKHNVVESK
jgi:hypothetical protein